ncbi:MAG: NUDIX hydrolase [Chloroflexota bacterium]|nr:NUDIX hydrolase [Chloroflexota bacterium]
MAWPISTIVVALVQRGTELLLVEAQGPDDQSPVWMLPGGQVEADEELLEALRRELAEETGLRIIGEPRFVFEVEVDYRTDLATGVYQALTYTCGAAGELQPADPDGLVHSAAWVESGDALDRLSMLEWYECEPLRRFLFGEALAGAAYRYRVTGIRGSMMREALEVVDRMS